MATTDNGRGVERDTNVDVLSAEEGLALFDRRARRELGISGEEFLRRWEAGLHRPIPDTPEGWKVGRLVMMMPFAGRALS
jgi:hypothetical protein